MKLFVTLFALSLLIGCNQQTQSEKPASEPESKPDRTTEAAPNKAAPQPIDSKPHSEENGHDHDHDHPEPNPNGYVEVEPKDVCGQPTITYFFAYQCPHCFELEKFTIDWLKTKPDNVKFVSVPTDLGRQEFGPFLLVHHAANKLNLLDKVKPVLFDLIHNKKELIQSLDQAIEILTTAGAEKSAAKAALEDETELLKQLRADYDSNVRYKITGVPAVLVNYQYKTSPAEAKGYKEVFDVVNKTLKLPAKCEE